MEYVIFLADVSVSKFGKQILCNIIINHVIIKFKCLVEEELSRQNLTDHLFACPVRHSIVKQSSISCRFL